MLGFIISGLVASVIFGIFICLIAVNNCKNKILGWILGILFSLAFGFGFIGIITLESQGNYERWNNGVCECGGDYKLAASNKSRMGSETFYYSCEDCGHTIKTTSLME